MSRLRRIFTKQSLPPKVSFLGVAAIISLLATKLGSYMQRPAVKVVSVAVVLLAAGYVFQQMATAATANLVPTSTVSSWPGGQTHANIDEGPTVTADAVTTGTGGTTGEIARFGVQDLANVSSATSLVLRYCAYSATNANGGTLDSIGARLYISGTGQTVSTASPAYQTSATSCTWHTATYSGSWNQAAVDSLEMEFTRNRLGSGGPSNQDDDVRIVSAYVDVTYTVTLQLTQSNYRWYANADSNSPGTPLAAQDTVAEVPAGEPFRLRQLVNVASGPLPAGSGLKLEYAEKVGTCSASSYVPVGGFVAARKPATATSNNIVGDIAWSTPSDSIVSNNADARYWPFIINMPSQYLWSNGYGFDIPASATITGIEVRYEGSVDTASGFYSVDVRMVKNGTITGTSDGIGSESPDNDFSTVDSVAIFGGVSSLWGTTWTPADINDPDFGAALQATVNGDDSVFIDATEIYVYYEDNSAAVGLFDNPSVLLSQAAGTASNPTPASGSITEQRYSELAGFANTAEITTGNNLLVDFALYSPDATVDTTYCFRMVKDDNSPLDTYTHYPEITVLAPTLTQANHRWLANANSITPGSALAAQDTPASIAAETPFRLRQRIAADTANLGPSGQNFKLQYAEKSGTCDVGFSGESYADMYALPGNFSVSNSAVLRTVSQVDNPSGTETWSSISNAAVSDNNRANVSFSGIGYTQSEYLVVGGDMPSIPAGATITGIRIGVEGLYNLDSNANAYLALDGVIKGSAQNTNMGTLESVVYTGSSSDLWGASWSAAEINAASSFQIYIFADLYDSFGPPSVQVDDTFAEVYYTVPTVQPIAYYNNVAPADNTTISSTANDPTNGARPTVYQKYRETDPFTNSVAAIPSGSDGIWDFSFTSAPEADGKTYCFRVVKPDGGLLDTYSTIPEMYIGFTGPTLDQQMRGGNSVLGGQKGSLTW